MKIESVEEENDGMILCVNTPARTEFGVDYYSYIVSDEFVGMKNVPFGTHLVFYSFFNDLSSYMTQNSARICLFVTLSRENPIVLLRYNAEIEDYELLDSEKEESKQIVNQYMNQYAHKLGPYPMDKSWSIWNKLANFITPKVISRLEPLQKKIFSTLSIEESNLLRKQKEDFYHQRNQEMEKEKNEYRVYYTHIPSKLKRQGVKGHELTKLNFDKSALLYQLLKEEYENDWTLLLGELQFAFVCFLMGQALDALEQWKRIIELLCSCDDVMHNASMLLLFRNFVSILYNELEVIPKDFFHDELSQNNFLKKQLSSFLQIVLSDGIHDNELVSLTKKMDQLLMDRFKLQSSLEEEDSEDAPIIVELDE
jgi:A1 cistron-splicing factor AAR2